MKNRHGLAVLSRQKVKQEICTCGQAQYGFDCVCDFVKVNKGNNEYSCEYCGLYKAAKARCNKCERISHE